MTAETPRMDAPLLLSRQQFDSMVAHCLDGLPDEACGLLSGPVGGDGQATGEIGALHPARNADGSALTYTVEPRDMLAALRSAEEAGHEVVGVWHSHTHTDAYPSATDVRQAVDPMWIYVIVSLRDIAPVMRAYRIRDGDVAEVPVRLVDGPEH